MSNPLTKTSPLLLRILAWMDERFPFKNMPAWIVWYLLAAFIARFTVDPENLYVGLYDIVGALVTWSFFLLLRVFDEHKDYELDCHNHPDRVLQSGLITLGHLKVIGVLCVALSTLWALYLDDGVGVVTVSWLVVFGYSLLMAKEFFVGAWLEQRLVIYALSHQVVIPMTIWWICAMGAPDVVPSMLIYWLMGLSFATGMTMEIVRKTRGPEEERDTVDSYSKVFGTKGSAYLVLILATFMLLQMLAVCGFIVSEGFYVGYGIIFLGYALVLFSMTKFLLNPTLEGREKNEVACALFMLLGYLVLISAVIAERQIQFSLWV